MLGQTRPTGPRILRVESLEARDVPATVAVADFYTVARGGVLTVPFSNGVLANDFSDTAGQAGATLTAAVVGDPVYVGSQRPLPNNSLFLSDNGSFTFIAPTDDVIPVGASQVQFFYTAQNTATNEIAQGVVTITLQGSATRLIAVGADAGGSPEVRVYTAGTSVLQRTITPYESEFTGGVRVAVGDVNGDGVDDIATIPQSGGSVRLSVFSGVDGAPLINRFVFDPDFRGGGYVAIGDVNGDNRQDIIVGAGEGGGPRVSVFTYDPLAADLSDTQVLADFFAYDATVRSGVRVAAGDLTGRGQVVSGNAFGVSRDSLVTSPGRGGGPQVNVYNQQLSGTRLTPSFSFFAGSSDNRDGVFVSTGQFAGNGKADIVVGGGAGAATIAVYDGRSGGLTRQFTVAQEQTPTGGGTQGGPGSFNFQTPQNGALLSPTLVPGSLVPAPSGTGAFGVQQGGVRVGTVDFDGDGIDEILAASGAGNSPRVRVISSKDQTEVTSIFPFASAFLGGVNVSGSPAR